MAAFTHLFPLLANQACVIYSFEGTCTYIKATCVGVSLISTLISYFLSILLVFWFNNANGKHGYCSPIPVLHVVGFFNFFFI